jgi:hypothetical protein
MITSETHTQTYVLRSSHQTIERIKARCRTRRYAQVPTNYEIIDEALKLYDRWLAMKLAKEDEKRLPVVDAGEGGDEA